MWTHGTAKEFGIVVYRTEGVLDAVVATSRIGSYAREARFDMGQLAVDNLLKGLGGL